MCSIRNNQLLTENNETCTQRCRGGATSSSLQGQEHGRNRQNTADGGQHAHRDVGNLWLQVIHANVFEVKVSVEPAQPSRQCNEELRERRMNVHEEAALDVLGSEPTEAAMALSVHVHESRIDRNHLLDLVEDNAARLLDPEEPNSSGKDSQCSQQGPVRAWEIEDVMVLHTLGGVALDFLLRLLLLSTVSRP